MKNKYKTGTKIKFMGFTLSLEERWVLRTADGTEEIENVGTSPVEDLEHMKEYVKDYIQGYYDDDYEFCSVCGKPFPRCEGQMTGFHNRTEATDQLICLACKERYYYEDDEGIWEKDSDKAGREIAQ